jgi:flagellar motility protein MotE (MotC chaperone)
MIRLLRDFRLIPLVLVAAIALFALKALGLIFDGGYTFAQLRGTTADQADVTGSVPAQSPAPAAAADPPPLAPAAPPRQSWANQMFNFPDVTGSVGDGKTEPKQESPANRGDRGTSVAPPANNGGWTPVPLSGERAPSPAERAILERLHERRGELEARAREIDIREGLLRAAEKRLEGRLGELKDIEARINGVLNQRDQEEAARFKNVVTMYETMRAKDAAKVFDRLDLKILVEVATKINPRRMADILGQMSPEAAERLTVELAQRPKDRTQPAELPKIEGRPSAN